MLKQMHPCLSFTISIFNLVKSQIINTHTHTHIMASVYDILRVNKHYKHQTLRCTAGTMHRLFQHGDDLLL